MNHYQILFSQRSASWKLKQPHIWNLRDGSAFFQQRKCLIYHLTKEFFRLPESSFQLLLVFRIGELSISLLRLWKQSAYMKEKERYQSTTGREKKKKKSLICKHSLNYMKVKLSRKRGQTAACTVRILVAQFINS